MATLTAVAGVVAAGVVVAPFGAGAATLEFRGWAGGTRVVALGGAVISDFTAVSSLDTVDVPNSSSNAIAAVDLKGLGSVGAVTTTQTAQAVTGGKKLVSRAHVAGVNLLGGLITASAVDTTATVTNVDGTSTAAGKTDFVGLKILGVTLPVNIPQNFGVELKGVATIALNGFVGRANSDGTAVANSAGLYVKLLKSVGSSPAGTEIFLSPAHADIVLGTPSGGLPIYGTGYATKINASALGALSVYSGPTAYNVIRGGGTDGKDAIISTARVDIPGVAAIGAVQTIANGYSKPDGSSASMTVNIANVNLLGGLIKADALTGTASASRLPGATAATKATTSLVNLVIAGNAIPVNVAPNTKITIGTIAVVTVNAQVTTSNGAAVRLLDIKLTTAGFGLPVGAEIEVGAASAIVG